MDRHGLPVLAVSVALLFLLVALAACSSTSTFGKLAERGGGLFSTYCSSCHGSGGEGGGGAPPVYGRFGLDYQNAEQVFDKIRFEMPKNWPATMAASEYRQILSYILVQGGYVDPQDKFSDDALSQITFP